MFWKFDQQSFNAIIVVALLSVSASANDDGGDHADDNNGISGSAQCVNGSAESYTCSHINLMGRVSMSALGLGGLSDIWGWTDPITQREYAIVGHFNGTSFVDVTDPSVPVITGYLPAHEDVITPSSKACSSNVITGKNSKRRWDRGKLSSIKSDAVAHDDGCGSDEGSSWRDIKVYANHAFIVSEATGHGMQVFDLARLRGNQTGVVFSEDAHYSQFSSAHNLVINPQSGFAYAVGTNTFLGGLHIIDIREPKVPVGAGGFSADGYTHDAQCVTYQGPDANYLGREICVACNENTVTLVDVTDKSAPSLISRNTYADARYVHQGWLSEDQRFFYQNDELDEREFGGRTSTQIWDMSDLDKPVLVHRYLGLATSTDHNNYTLGNYLLQSNYSSGLRVLDISNPTRPIEVAFFDSFSFNDAVGFEGTWSNYPYFPSGNIILSDRSEGLFVLSPMFMDETLIAADIEIQVRSSQQLTSSSASRVSFRYELDVVNRSSETVHDVLVTHILAGAVESTSGDAQCEQRTQFLECRVETLLAGESATIVLDQSAPGQSSIPFEVYASAMEPDSNSTNSKASGTISLNFISPPLPSSGGGGAGGSIGIVALLALGAAFAKRRFTLDI